VRTHASRCVVLASCLAASGTLAIGLLGGCDIVLDINGLDRTSSSSTTGGGSAPEVVVISDQECHPGKIFADESHVFWTTTSFTAPNETQCKDQTANGIYRAPVDAAPHSNGTAVVIGNVTGDGKDRPWALTVLAAPGGGQTLYWVGDCGRVLTADALGAMQTGAALVSQPSACATGYGIAPTRDGDLIFAGGCNDGCNPAMGIAGSLYSFDPSSTGGKKLDLPLTAHFDLTVSVAAKSAQTPEWVAWIDEGPSACAVDMKNGSEVRVQRLDGSDSWSSCDAASGNNHGRNAQDVVTDGSRLYWLEGDQKGSGELYAIDLPPGNQTPATIGPTLDDVHALSVDDHYIYFTTGSPHGEVRYYPKGVADPSPGVLETGGNPYAITASNSQWVFWLVTPDGTPYGSVHRAKKPAPPH
jgi:hypothetical protein